MLRALVFPEGKLGLIPNSPPYMRTYYGETAEENFRETCLYDLNDVWRWSYTTLQDSGCAGFTVFWTQYDGKSLLVLFFCPSGSSPGTPLHPSRLKTTFGKSKYMWK